MSDRLFPALSAFGRFMSASERNASSTAITHQGGPAKREDGYPALRRTVLTCLLWENTFYETGSRIAARIAELVPQVPPAQVAALAVEARDRMKLRRAPLLLVRELARIKGNGSLVRSTMARVIQRADELSEFLEIYWRDGRQPLAKAVQRGLADALQTFDAYQLAKYNRKGSVKLRDVLFLCHAKPKDAAQAETWKKLVERRLESPDTWEVALSKGADKKETFERLLRERKLGGLAVLRNIRQMARAGVDRSLIAQRLGEGIEGALPFHFVTATRRARDMEPFLEAVMLKSCGDMKQIPGRTGLLVDVSASMKDPLSTRSRTMRIDAASGLAILLRELCGESLQIATFSNSVVGVAPQRGFALAAGVRASQRPRGTVLKGALEELRALEAWSELDRLIVITDEQSQDGIADAFTPRAYVINVAPYEHGVTTSQGWTRIDGWSERVLDYIVELEAESPVEA
jgi:60 kDa SS-A/Ro ribonucleoprotein